jgi:CBS-domain-containing membrane protein
MRVAEIMQKDVFTISKDASIKECGDLLEKHDVNGMPAVDGDQVVGIVTRADIFKAILPKYSDIYINERYLMDFECIEDRIHKIKELKVKDLMAPNPLTLDQDTPLVKAGSLMILRGIKQMPVVENGKLLGIITLTDICRNFLKRVK